METVKMPVGLLPALKELFVALPSGAFASVTAGQLADVVNALRQSEVVAEDSTHTEAG